MRWTIADLILWNLVIGIVSLGKRDASTRSRPLKCVTVTFLIAEDQGCAARDATISTTSTSSLPPITVPLRRSPLARTLWPVIVQAFAMAKGMDVTPEEGSRAIRAKTHDFIGTKNQ
jgi:hypothetical protein